jgi:hypothetical protein
MQGELLHSVTLDGQDNTVMKKVKRKAGPPTPVIAVRVSEVLHLRIKAAAAQSGRSMSEEMAWLLENGFEWQQALGDRDTMLEKARQLLHEAIEQARRIPEDALELRLRRQNWRPDGKGGWRPPEVHGLPADGFVEAKATESAAVAPNKKRRAR